VAIGLIGGQLTGQSMRIKSRERSCLARASYCWQIAKTCADWLPSTAWGLATAWRSTWAAKKGWSGGKLLQNCRSGTRLCRMQIPPRGPGDWM